MTTEVKPGKWRLKDGREVVVLWDSVGYGIYLWVPEHKTVITREQGEFEGAECLGPALIGEVTPEAVGYWVRACEKMEQHCKELEQQCKDLEAETVKTRELLEKSEERCEELARQLEQPVKSQWAYVPVIPRAQEAETKLASAECVIEGLEERVRFLEEQAAGMPEVADENGVKIYRFKSVTVMVRGEREASCRYRQGSWFGLEPQSGHRCCKDTSEDAEAWCREQLEPRWREATEGDVGKACRVRDSDDQCWLDGERLLAIIDHEIRFVGITDGCGEPAVWRYCEVQD